MNDVYSHHQNSATLSVGTIRFEDRFCASRKGRTGGGGWVHHFRLAVHMVAVAAGYRKGLVSTGWPVLVQTNVENSPFTL